MPSAEPYFAASRSKCNKIFSLNTSYMGVASLLIYCIWSDHVGRYLTVPSSTILRVSSFASFFASFFRDALFGAGFNWIK